MKILFTGSTGFIGSHLLEELLQRHEIWALVRTPQKLEKMGLGNRVHVIRGDLFFSEPFPEEIEAVVHLAAITKAVNPSEFIRTNQEGASAFLDRIGQIKNIRRVIHLSSLAAAGPTLSPDPLTEEDPPHPVSKYGKSKLMEEETFRQKSPVPPITIRAPIVFGPRDLDMLDALRLLARGFLPILHPPHRQYSIIYVKDLVRGIAAALESEVGGGLFYMANRDPVEWDHFMTSAARCLGRKKIHRIQVPRMAARVFAELSEWRCRIGKKRAIFNRDKFCEMVHPRWLCSAEKCRRLIHFSPAIDLESAMEETIAWYRGENLLP